MDAIIGRIALETAIPETSVSAAVALLQNGAAGPFIARYRKEATGGLDEIKIRVIQDRLAHYREALELKTELLKTLTDQGALNDELQSRIEGCFSKSELEDMQRRFRPRKKTRAAEAIEKGLQPLAEYFWKQEPDSRSIDERLDVFVDPARGVLNREQALQGVVDILTEWIWENGEHRKTLREMLWSEGRLVSAVVPAKVGQKTKYNMYYDRREPVSSVPSHRVLAIRRGCKEGVLVSSVEGDNAKAIEYLLSSVLKNKDDRESEFFAVLEVAVRESYNKMLRPMIETEVRTQLKERADREAIKVFQENLTSLLLAPPAGPIVVMGVDMGKGRECSLAVIDETGGFLDGAKIRLTEKSMVSMTPAANEAEVPVVSAKSAETAEVSETAESAEAIEIAETAEVVESTESTEAGEAAETMEAAETVEATEITATAESAETVETVEVPESAEAAEAVESAESTEAAETTEAATEATETEDAAAEPVTVPIETGETVSAEDTAAVVESAAENAAVDPLSAMLASLTAPAVVASYKPARVEKAVNPRIVLKDLIARHKVQAIAIGAGANARELENLLRQVLVKEGLTDVFIAAVNDAGLAIYSSSRLAREEFPNRSASLRCAVSLARRLQDPLSEMVKLDPKLIGVGQYQHDVDQKELHRALTQTVQFCVNNVGVNLNAAGSPLLRYVCGLNDKLARRIVAVRSSQGPFASRAAMNEALKLEPAVYEQAAAFLRVTDGESALDRTAVHPESYPIVEKMAAAASVSVGDLIGNRELVEAVNLDDYVTETTGLPTLMDIREELLRPGRDPRRTFRLPKFNSDVKELSDLKPGMIMEGIVTNVTNFGAFVDVGVRQDGLVHLSQMSSRFINDPREAVKVGDVVEVRVISVDSETKRIGLSMKTAASSGAQRKRSRRPRRDGKVQPREEGRAGTNGRSAKPVKEAGKEGETASGRRERPSRFGGRNAAPRRDEKRPPRRPEQRPAEQFYATSSTEQAPVEPVYEGPEPSLEEKIAILQSKFRGIK